MKVKKETFFAGVNNGEKLVISCKSNTTPPAASIVICELIAIHVLWLFLFI